MATTTIKRPDVGRLGLTALAGAFAIAIGFAVATIVAASILLNRVEAPAVEAPALSPMDDYWFRHQPAPAQLGPMDDYWFRQQLAPVPLTELDDFYFRHQGGPAPLGPMDDYGLRHGNASGGR